MTRKRFLCQKCGHEFVVEVFEHGEQEKKRIKGAPVTCDKCGSAALKEI